MTASIIRRCILAAVITTSATRCVSITKLPLADEPRRQVRFESNAAMETFHDGLLARRFPREGRYSSISFGITPYNPSTRSPSNVAFNQAVISADTNHNGTISEREANAYAASPAAR